METKKIALLGNMNMVITDGYYKVLDTDTGEILATGKMTAKMENLANRKPGKSGCTATTIANQMTEVLIGHHPELA